MGIEPTNLLHAMQALYQLSYAPIKGPAIVPKPPGQEEPQVAAEFGSGALQPLRITRRAEVSLLEDP